MPLRRDLLRQRSSNEVFVTGDRSAQRPLRGSSRHRRGPPKMNGGSPGSLLSPKWKNTGLRLSTQSRRSGCSFDRSAYVSGLGLRIVAFGRELEEALLSAPKIRLRREIEPKKRGLSRLRLSPLTTQTMFR